MITCPFCDTEFTEQDIVSHIATEHSPFYAKLCALSLRLGYQEKQQAINTMLKEMR